MSSLQGELILGVAYGYEVHGLDDRLLRASTRRVRFAAEVILPGALLINYIPLCMFVCCSFFLPTTNIPNSPHTLEYVTSLSGSHG